jgi:hypothetical protein
MKRFLQEPALASAYGHASLTKAQDWHPDAGAAKWMEALRTVLA